MKGASLIAIAVLAQFPHSNASAQIEKSIYSGTDLQVKEGKIQFFSGGKCEPATSVATVSTPQNLRTCRNFQKSNPLKSNRVQSYKRTSTDGVWDGTTCIPTKGTLNFARACAEAFGR